jgi:hypothetical protein
MIFPNLGKLLKHARCQETHKHTGETHIDAGVDASPTKEIRLA